MKHRKIKIYFNMTHEFTTTRSSFKLRSQVSLPSLLIRIYMKGFVWRLQKLVPWSTIYHYFAVMPSSTCKQKLTNYKSVIRAHFEPLLIIKLLKLNYMTVWLHYKVYYTVIKHDRHLRTRGKRRRHKPQASVFYISWVFSMTGVFYHSVIHGLGFFICFMI